MRRRTEGRGVTGLGSVGFSGRGGEITTLVGRGATGEPGKWVVLRGDGGNLGTSAHTPTSTSLLYGLIYLPKKKLVSQ